MARRQHGLPPATDRLGATSRVAWYAQGLTWSSQLGGSCWSFSLPEVFVTAVETRPSGVVGTSPRHRPATARAKAFVALTKPRIIELLLITTVPAMFLAAAGVPNLWLGL